MPDFDWLQTVVSKGLEREGLYHRVKNKENGKREPVLGRRKAVPGEEGARAKALRHMVDSKRVIRKGPPSLGSSGS